MHSLQGLLIVDSQRCGCGEFSRRQIDAAPLYRHGIQFNRIGIGKIVPGIQRQLIPTLPLQDEDSQTIPTGAEQPLAEIGAISTMAS